MEKKNINISIQSILERYELGSINLEPPYQRGYVWKENLKSELILSILEDYPIGNIVLHKNELVDIEDFELEYIHDTVDGQQRLKSIIGFCKNLNWSNNNNKNVLNSEVSRMIIEKNYDSFVKFSESSNVDKSIKRQVRMLLKNYDENKINNLRLSYELLPPRLKQRIKLYEMQGYELISATDQEIREYFRRVQNQEKLKAGEIINSLPDSKVRDFVMGIERENLIEEVLGFNDKNNELLKLLAFIYGYLDDDAVKFGSTDKILMTYLGKNKELNTIAVNKMNKINDTLQSMENGECYTKINKKTQLKIFLLFISEGKVNALLNDFSQKQIIRAADMVFSIMPFLKSTTNDFDEKFSYFPDLIREWYKNIDGITARSHPQERVEEAINCFSKLIRFHIEEHIKYEKIKENKELREKQQKTLMALLSNDGLSTDELTKRLNIDIGLKAYILDKNSYKCHSCNKELNLRNVEIDHIIPFSKGGPSHEDNYLPICSSCNKEKGNKTY